MSKRNLVLVMLLMIIGAACQEEKECTNESLNQYRYDPGTGKCTNCVGQAGYNPVDTQGNNQALVRGPQSNEKHEEQRSPLAPERI